MRKRDRTSSRWLLHRAMAAASVERRRGALPERLPRISLRDGPNVHDQTDVEVLLAYIADRARWTEHGTSIRGAWLTDNGKRVLRLLDAAQR
jgi:hypothetical protein